MHNRNCVNPGRVVQDFFTLDLGYAAYASSDGYYPTLIIKTLFQPNNIKSYLVNLICDPDPYVTDPYGFKIQIFKDSTHNKFYYLDTEMPDLCPSQPFDTIIKAAEEIDQMLLEWLDDNMVHWDMIYEEPSTLTWWTDRTGKVPVADIPLEVLGPINPPVAPPDHIPNTVIFNNPPTTLSNTGMCRKSLNLDLLSKIKK